MYRFADGSNVKDELHGDARLDQRYEIFNTRVTNAHGQQADT
jgi:hypothetical protein